MNFTEQQIERYSRHIILDGIGGEGQQKIMNFKVLVVGAGGLGSPAIFYLAAAGVGKIGILDSDVVELSNLQRQIIHFTSDIEKPKTESAARKVKDINPDVKVETYYERLTEKNILKIIADYDFIISCADNFSTKFLINDACVLKKKPYSHAGVVQFSGQTFTYIPETGNCLRCVFENPPPAGAVPPPSQAGILGVVAGIFGTIQAAEALRFAIGKGELITNSILTMDVMNMEFKKLLVAKNTECPVCSDKAVITSLEAERYLPDMS